MEVEMGDHALAQARLEDRLAGTDDRPRCSDEGEFDPLLEQLKRHHEIVDGRVRERLIAEGGEKLMAGVTESR
jgi:hypothetical protein